MTARKEETHHDGHKNKNHKFNKNNNLPNHSPPPPPPPPEKSAVYSD